MSGYPYGYPYQGQPPPQQQQYPSYQPYGTYPPPTNGFGTTPPQAQQHQQHHYAPPANGYYTNAQSAYDYNASSIPGLGTPSSGPPPFPAPYNGAWHQGGYGNSASQEPYHAYAPTAPPSSTPTTYPYPQTQATVSQVPPPANPIQPTQSKLQSEITSKPQSEAQPAKQPKPQDANAEGQEEGEIDDGYFDDLYDDASKAPSVNNETMAVAGKASGHLVEDSSDQEPNFYDTDMEDVSATQEPVTMAGKKTGDSIKLRGQPGRDRSRSYSPHLSPAEIREYSPSLHEAAGYGNAEAGTQEQRGSTAVAAAPTSITTQGDGSRSDNGVDTEAPKVAVTSLNSKIAPSTSFASVSEASNEAKKAILKLLPHGVKYQTFIDEGFDAQVVKGLFTQLNLPTDTSNSGPPEKSPTHQGKGVEPPASIPAQQTQTDTMAKKQEERKDRIARLMAEKKAKLAAASNNTGAAAAVKGGESSTSVVAAPPVRPPITRAEKDRLLAQKVEALRNKAREAKKLTQKSAPAQASQPDAARNPTPPASVSKVTAQAPVAVQSASVTPLSSASQSAAPSPGVSTLPPVPRATQINQRKRPVAADFMDYPPFPVKRPSLANRQNSSLVISISDDEDEDEDEDVEMEVDSATEDSPASLPQTLTLTRRGPSIRDFPPLSNIKITRQVHSPVSGSSSIKTSNADLETKERAILEMQKKIKELEAKKQAKVRSGNATPRSPSVSGVLLPEQLVQTPVRRIVTSSDADDKTTPSAQLLQEAEAASVPMPKLATPNPHTEDARLVRIPSAQISGKSAKALEKAERLRRMQEEMQKLQAEIDQEGQDVEAEDQRMSEEAEAPAQLVEKQASQGMLAPTGAEPDRVAEVRRVESSAASNEHGQLASNPSPHDAQSVQIDSPSGPSHDMILTNQLATPTTAPSDLGKLPDAPGSIASLQPREESAVTESGDLDDYEPPEPKMEGRVGIDSPRFSPAPSQVAHSATQQRGEMAKTAREVLVGSSHPFDASLTHSKAVNDTASTRQASFAPYESPLRYYHAYRFHTNYNDGVPGGLKSLTYSNRIDPNKEMCPDEWEGNDCPRGDACQFQHFQSIVAPDSEIILELGSSDEFTGEQKREFNNGLREVVASFQKSKVRDFRTIAQAIVDFRHRFLGDPSKVLRLEGVNI